jgi:hypothetical protein
MLRRSPARPLKPLLSADEQAPAKRECKARYRQLVKQRQICVTIQIGAKHVGMLV